MLCEITGGSKHQEGQHRYKKETHHKKPETPFPLSLVHNFPNCPVCLITLKGLEWLKGQTLPGAHTSGLYFGHPQEFARTGYFCAGSSQITPSLSYHLTTEVPFVHIPANFQHINRANEGAEYRHTDEYSQRGARLSFFFCCGNF